MSVIGGDGGIRRALESGRGRPAEALARAAELANGLSAILDEQNARGPEETAQLLVEVPRLPAPIREAFLTAAAGLPPVGSKPLLRELAETVRERIAQAFPEGGERRQQLGAALVSLEGGERGSPAASVLEAKVTQALAKLGVVAAAARAHSADRVERPRGFGPFGGTATAPTAMDTPATATASGTSVWSVAELIRARAVSTPEGSLLRDELSRSLEGLPQAWEPIVAAAQELAPGLTTGLVPLGKAEGLASAVRRGLGGMGEGQGVWSRARMAASLDAFDRVASRFEGLRERLGGGFALAAPESGVMRAAALTDAVRRLRGEAALARQELARARDLVPDVALPAVGTAPEVPAGADQEMAAADYALQAYVTQQEMVTGQAPAADVASDAGSGRISEEELALIGTGITESPPAQGFWNIGTVGAGMEPAFSCDGYCQAAAEAVNRTIGDSSTVRPIEGAELAAAIRDTGVPLEQVDPNQLQAALGYINTGASGAVAEFGRGAPSTVDEQRERLALALRQFRCLAEHGPSPMDRGTAINVMWSAARIPGHAFEKLSDAEVLAAAQRTAAACNTPGSHEFKVGRHTVKLTIGDGGQVASTSTKAPSFWGTLGHIAKGALTVASFIPGPVGLVARGVQAGLTLVNAVRNGGGLLNIVAAGASFVGAGAAAVGRIARAGSNLARMAGSVARVANSFSGAVRGAQGIERGGLGGIITGAAGIANGFVGVVQGTGAGAGSSLGRFAAGASDVGRALDRVGAGVTAAESYIHANRAVADAREALEQARAFGDLAQIRQAEQQLGDAERAKRSAVLGGMAAAGQIAGDTLSRDSTGQPEPRTSQVPQQGRSGFQVGAEVFSRGMNAARGANEGDLLSAGVEAFGGLAAARQGTRPIEQELAIGPDGLPIPLLDASGHSLPGRFAMRDDFGALNRASSVLDGMNAWRGAERGEKQAREAVEQAEQALGRARASGDLVAIREAEEGLRLARRGLVEAEITSTLALDNAAERFTGAVDTFQNSRAAEGYRAEQERQFERVAVSLERATDLALDLAQVIDDPRFSVADRQQAAELREKLATLVLKYESDVAGAAADPRRLAEINEEYADFLARIDGQIPRLRVAALGVSDWQASSQTAETTSPREVRAEALKHVAIDERILSEAEKEIQSAPRDREGFSYQDPNLARAAGDMKKALDELKALGSNPNATDDEILAASLRLNVARNALSQTRNPTPGAPDPLVVGVTTFIDEFGSRAGNLITLGGKTGIERALKDGRLNADSDFLDVTKAYWEGVLNGVTFGGAEEYEQSRADRRSVVGNLALGALRFGEGVFAVDEYKVLTDPTTNSWQKAEALSSMVAKYAALGAGGKTLQERITARQVARTPPGGPADKIGPKSGAPTPSVGSGSKPEVLAGSKLEHQNASIAEIHAYDTAIKGGHIPIQGPGKVTARGPDLLTYDPVSREVVVWDAKYRGPGGSYPSSVPPAKLQKWLPDVRAAIEAMPSGPRKSAILDALAKGRILGKVFKWPPQ